MSQQINFSWRMASGPHQLEPTVCGEAPTRFAGRCHPLVSFYKKEILNIFRIKITLSLSLSLSLSLFLSVSRWILKLGPAMGDFSPLDLSRATFDAWAFSWWQIRRLRTNYFNSFWQFHCWIYPGSRFLGDNSKLGLNLSRPRTTALNSITSSRVATFQVQETKRYQLECHKVKEIENQSLSMGLGESGGGGEGWRCVFKVTVPNIGPWRCWPILTLKPAFMTLETSQ